MSEHDFCATSRWHGDKITVDVYPNGAALIQVALKLIDGESWHAIRLTPAQTAKLRALLSVKP